MSMGFVPCGSRSLCSSSHDGTEREKGQKPQAGTTTTTSSCGVAFARWLMALQESDEGKRREVVEEVVGSVGEEEKDKVKAEGKEGDEKAEVENLEIEEDEEDASICIPPKNALLLMRCRSEPFRMASLANRFWDSPAQKEYQSVDGNADKDDEEEEGDEEDLDEEQPAMGRKRTTQAADNGFPIGGTEQSLPWPEKMETGAIAAIGRHHAPRDGSHSCRW